MLGLLKKGCNWIEVSSLFLAKFTACLVAGFLARKVRNCGGKLVFLNSYLDHKMKGIDKRRWRPQIVHMRRQNSL